MQKIMDECLHFLLGVEIYNFKQEPLKDVLPIL